MWRSPSDITNECILFGCLDWGFGHFARSLPLILKLERQGNKVVFLGSEALFSVLKCYGFQGEWAELPATGFRFRGNGRFLAEAFYNFRTVQKAKARDHRVVTSLARKFEASMVVSDHRYGFYVDGLQNVMITHQTRLPAGWLANRIHRRWLCPFQTIWIPDQETGRLAGKLSAPLEKAVYIGWLSRFQIPLTDSPVVAKKVIVISGPEPYATQLALQSAKMTWKDPENWMVLSAVPRAEFAPEIRQIHDWVEGDRYLSAASCVVSRAGYSTLMDLRVLGKKAILIPTPGQPEQYYLAKLHANHPDWQFQAQD